MMSLKKGTQALNVFITIAPAQNNATSVQYAAVALKTDLPFPPDAGNIEYSPDRPLLTAVTSAADRQDAGFLSQGAWPRAAGRCGRTSSTPSNRPAGPPAWCTERGAYAHYVNDKEPAVVLVLTEQPAEAGKIKVEVQGVADRDSA